MDNKALLFKDAWAYLIFQFVVPKQETCFDPVAVLSNTTAVIHWLILSFYW